MCQAETIYFVGIFLQVWLFLLFVSNSRSREKEEDAGSDQ